ncbi:MAG: FkbM family methyltransferase [Proteobacteria bacterium]|nr:FkbM family methyltransferase [Pseudomonadota bacterium]
MVRRILQKLFNTFGYRISKIHTPMKFPVTDVLDFILRDYLNGHPDFFFLQIGANDGFTDDPIVHLVKKYHLRGLLVEPQPIMFKRLVKNYSGEDQLIFENSLITTYDGTATFYSVPEDLPGLPYNFYQAGSLKREVLLSILVATQQAEKGTTLPHDIESLVHESSLSALMPETLLAKHHINKIDLLVVDATGYDFQILKAFPFHLMKPPIIHFEHAILSIDDQEKCLKYLAELGYSFIDASVDTIACLDVKTRPGFYFRR